MGGGAGVGGVGESERVVKGNRPSAFLSEEAYRAWLRVSTDENWETYLQLSYRDYQLADPEPDHWSEDLADWPQQVYERRVQAMLEEAVARAHQGRPHPLFRGWR